LPSVTDEWFDDGLWPARPCGAFDSFTPAENGRAARVIGAKIICHERGGGGVLRLEAGGAQRLLRAG
jgi:hypothetical protein